jgi:nicotinamide-nucleotide amidase
MNAEIISIGTELLLGEITDTNSAHIARTLRDIGLDLLWISSIGDNEARIAELVRHAMTRSDVIITTGGLGPTVDDPTREAVAQACSLALEFRPQLWEQIKTRFKRFGREATDNNRKQAYVPAGALALENPVGTAPCFIVESGRSVIISLPGVPREMEHMLAHAVVPYLRRKFNLTGVIKAKVLRTVGLGESQIDQLVGDLERLSNPTVGLAAHPGQTDIRITAKAASEAEALALIAPIEVEVRARLGEVIYGEGKETVEAVVARLLAEHGQTVAVAEAGTGGQLSARLAATGQGAQIFYGGSILTAACTTPAMELAHSVRAERSAVWGLGLCLDPQASDHQIQIALVGAAPEETRLMGYAGPPASLALWASTSALNLLRQTLLRPGQ